MSELYHAEGEFRNGVMNFSNSAGAHAILGSQAKTYISISFKGMLSLTVRKNEQQKATAGQLVLQSLRAKERL